MTTCTTIQVLFDAYLTRSLAPARHSTIRDHLDTCPGCWRAWNVHRWDRAAHSPLLTELRAYLEETGQPYTPMRDSSRELAETWRQTGHTDRDAFFRTSEAYLYNLAIWQASGNRPAYLAEATRLLAEHPSATVADLGCGIGSDTLDLAAMGYKVTPIDYDSPSSRFARWRMRRAGLEDTIYEPGGLPPDLAPAVLWAVDTLDHIPDLETQLAPLLTQCRLVISEAQRHARRHGDHHYYVRRSPRCLDKFFAGYGLTSPAADISTPLLTAWTSGTCRTGNE